MSSSCTYSLIPFLSFLVTLTVSIRTSSSNGSVMAFIVIAARDGIIQADENRYNCRHGCLIWKAFAKHGLGIDANGTTDGFKVPSNCHEV